MKKGRENGRESTFDGCLVRDRGGKKIGGARVFSPCPYQNVFPLIQGENRRKNSMLAKYQIYPSPSSVSDDAYCLCTELRSHCVLFFFSMSCFFIYFYFLNSYCIFIQSFKQLLLHFLAFCFSLFLINGGGIKWGAFTLFLLLFKKAPLIFLYK